MKAIVIGGSGQIGGWLLRHLADRGHEAQGTYRTIAYPGLVRLDASDQEAAARWVHAERPDVVFYPAGFTWVDGCERDRARAQSANRDEPLNLARAARDCGAKFVYYSTDYLFDGTAGPDSEDSEPNPPNVYGVAKLEAERAIAEELGDQALIARTSWVFGPERQGKNFAYQLIKTLRAGKPMVVPSDQRSSPSYGPDVALATIRLVELGHSGLFHVAGPDVVSRPDFARAIARAFDLDEQQIEAKPTEELMQEARRPLQGGLRIEKLQRVLPGLMRPLNEALADFRARATEAPWLDPLAV